MEYREIQKKIELCQKAYSDGNIVFGKNLAEEILHELFAHKRIPTLKIFLERIKVLGYSKKKISEYEKKMNVLLGFEISPDSSMKWHIDQLKSNQEYLKNYLLEESEWELKHYTLCYEYLLRYGHDVEILNRIQLMQPQTLEGSFFEDTGRGMRSELQCNYDDIAYELISGKKSSDDFDQDKIISSLILQNIGADKKTAHEMLIAFSLLGMNNVVQYLGKLILINCQDIKIKAGVTFSLVDSLINTKNYHLALETIETFLNTEPIYGEEKIAFLYQKAEIYFLLNKKEEALKLFREIKIVNPHYRLVNQRLRLLEID